MSSDRRYPELHAQPGLERSTSGGCAPSRSSGKASLLALPQELRRFILKGLLSSDDPIELASDPISQARAHFCPPKRGTCPATKFQRLYPSVLRTCKQLYDEGAGVLYDNTISARVSCSATEQCCRPDDCVVLSTRYGLRHPLPKAVIERISKVRIQIFVKQYDLVSHCPRVLSDGARELYKMIESIPQWREVMIDIEQIGDPEDFDLAMLIVPFSYLRRCQAVKITTPYKAVMFDQIANTMMSNDPVVDLHRMYESLDEYRDRFVDVYRNNQQVEPEEAAIMGRIEDDLMDDLVEARDYDELKEFCEIREQILASLAELQAWRHALIFRSDPPGWISGHAPDSSVQTVASERPTQ